MEEIMNGQRSSASPLIDHPRRRFIKQSVAGGVVSAMMAKSALAGQATAVGCGTPSKSDWLVEALAFVSQISSEAFGKVITITTGQLTSYKTAFDELYCLLNELKGQLSPSSTTAKATIDQLKTLTEVGRVNTNLVKAAFSEGENTSGLLMSLAAISQDICSQTQRIEPSETEWLLSKRASGILKRIVELVSSQGFADLHSGVAKASVSISNDQESINHSLSQLQLTITAARTAILLAENPTQQASSSLNKKEQWLAADTNLVDALTALKTLISEQRVDSSLPSAFTEKLPASVLDEAQIKAVLPQNSDAEALRLTVADTLIFGLGTCRREIASESLTASNGASEFRIIKASYAAPVFIDRTRMGNLLWTYCPPGSRDQIDRIDSIIALVGGWSSWLPQAARAALIGSALYWSNKVHRISCSGSLSSLANELAALV
jgi:hypothetical protein